MSKEKICNYCKNEYTSWSKGDMYCSDECRFMLKVDKTDYCWNWKAGVSDSGYGQFSVRHKGYSAHRYSWIMHEGEIPQGKVICHTCDNKICVNPEHLFMGLYNKQGLQIMTEYKELSHWADEDLQYEICSRLSDITTGKAIRFVCEVLPLIEEFKRREEERFNPDGN